MNRSAYDRFQEPDLDPEWGADDEEGRTVTDKLADLETWAKGPLAIASIPRARDVLALVEIARAAQVVDQRSAKAPWFREYYKVDALAAAVARLQKENERGEPRVPWGPDHPSYDEMGQ